jgi:hypothetical protein
VKPKRFDFQEQRGEHYSAWARVRAAANEFGDTETGIVKDLIDFHYEAVYAYFRAFGATPTKALGAMNQLESFGRCWPRDLRPELWMYHGRFRIMLQVKLCLDDHHLVFLGSWPNTSAVMLPESLKMLEDALAPWLEDKATPSSLFYEVWRWSLGLRAQARLVSEWRDREMSDFAKALLSLLDEEPSPPELAALKSQWNQSEEEILMALSSFQRRYDELLAEQVQNTVATPDDFVAEWKDIYVERPIPPTLLAVDA